MNFLINIPFVNMSAAQIDISYFCFRYGRWGPYQTMQLLVYILMWPSGIQFLIGVFIGKTSNDIVMYSANVK